MFAGSCLGVIGLVVVLDFLHRLSREYDHFIRARDLSSYARVQPTSSSRQALKNGPTENTQQVASVPTSWLLLQQTVRAFMHAVQFGLAYVIMLLAMYYNGKLEDTELDDISANS